MFPSVITTDTQIDFRCKRIDRKRLYIGYPSNNHDTIDKRYCMAK